MSRNTQMFPATPMSRKLLGVVYISLAFLVATAVGLLTDADGIALSIAGWTSTVVFVVMTTAIVIWLRRIPAHHLY